MLSLSTKAGKQTRVRRVNGQLAVSHLPPQKTQTPSNSLYEAASWADSGGRGSRLDEEDTHEGGPIG